MTLSEKIMQLRRRRGWSQEELAEQMAVSRQSVSKWEGAQSVPDLDRIVQLSRLFGVSTDALLRDDLELPDQPAAPAEPTTAERPARRVTLAEARAFLDLQFGASRQVALAVALCILSPICLIVLSAAAEAGRIALGVNAAAGVGLGVLLVLVAPAVAIFVLYAMRVDRYEYLEKEPIEAETDAVAFAREKQAALRAGHMRAIVLGVSMCVLAVVPLLVGTLLLPEDGFYAAALVGVLLALVACGVACIVRSAICWGSLQRLLEEGDYTREKKQAERRYGDDRRHLLADCRRGISGLQLCDGQQDAQLDHLAGCRRAVCGAGRG